MIPNVLRLYLWLLKSRLWGVILYRRYRRLPFPLLSILSKLGLNPKNKDIQFHLDGYKHSICLRHESTDIDVLFQIFGEEEYSVLEPNEEFKLILDCGANVGYSSIYLLNKFNNARVIAVEPDEENFQVCQKNLLPYSDRATLINSAIWSHQTGLVVCKYGGREWSTQVKECPENQKPDLFAIDILGLLEKSGNQSIDLLKMDVEGSETVIFSQNFENWLHRIKNIVIELHGQECEKAFFKALSAYKYDLSRSGELTVCQRITPKAASIN